MATVFVWNNNMVTVGHGYPGHSSMNIDDNWRAEGQKSYVSFWPKKSASITAICSGTASDRLEEDMASENNYVPDHVIRINNMRVSDMKAKWLTVRNEYSTYNMLRQNCSGAVAEVLRAGSSAGSVLKRHNAIWTPLKVKRLAISMGGTKMRWSTFIDEVAATGAIDASVASRLKEQPKRTSKHGSSTVASTHNGSYRFGRPEEVKWTPALITASGGGTLLNTRPTIDWDMIDEALDG